MAFTFKHPYEFAPEYSKPVAYFCMEYAIAQPLKVYAGGLGYLAGSHVGTGAGSVSAAIDHECAELPVLGGQAAI
jgi:glucan phosphorylase